MKKFVTPEVEVEKLIVEDVITTSTCEDEVVGCDNDLGL